MSLSTLSYAFHNEIKLIVATERGGGGERGVMVFINSLVRGIKYLIC